MSQLPADCPGPARCPHVADARDDGVMALLGQLIETQSVERKQIAAETNSVLIDGFGRIETKIAEQGRQQWWLMVLVVLGLLGLAGSKAADELLSHLPIAGMHASAEPGSSSSTPTPTNIVEDDAPPTP